MPTMVFRIQGMHCIGCVNRIRTVLENFEVEHIEIKLDTNIVRVQTKITNPKVDVYLHAIQDQGYQAMRLATQEDE